MFAVDRAGVVGADGATHQGAFDLSFLRCIPNMIIMAPSNERECQLMLTTGHQLNQPSVVRYPRGSGTGETLPEITETIEVGKSITQVQGSDIAFLSFGSILNEVKHAAEILGATVIDMRFIKPLDTEAIINAVKAHNTLITVEDNAIAGGAGSGVNEFILKEGLGIKVLNIGIPDQFIKHGTQEEVHKELGLDSEGILASVKAFLA